MKPRVLVLHGPNLNLLGRREVSIYGSSTLADIDAKLVELGPSLGVEVLEPIQSNHEGVLIDRLHAAIDDGTRGLLINPGGLTHTSVSLRDAVSAATGLGMSAVEVHLSQPEARENFRHHSFLSGVVSGRVSGFGALGYELGLRGLAAAISP